MAALLPPRCHHYDRTGTIRAPIWAVGGPETGVNLKDHTLGADVTHPLQYSFCQSRPGASSSAATLPLGVSLWTDILSVIGWRE